MYTLSQKGSPTLAIVTWKGKITRF